MVHFKKIKTISKGMASACCAIFVVVALSVGSSIVYFINTPTYSKQPTKFTVNSYDDSLSYQEVCWLTSHNSFAHPGSDLAIKMQFVHNQTLTISEQLEYGVKSFMIDLWYKNEDDKKEIVIAHAARIFSNRTPLFFEQSFLGFLKIIENWLNTHPEDIITIHLESWVGNYEKIIEVIKTAKLYDYLFDLDQNKNWPTLGEMRKTKKRLVIFSDTGDDKGFGIMPLEERYMETEYDLGKYEGCEMRTDHRAPIHNADLFVMNHFYGMPPMINGIITKLIPPFVYEKTHVNNYEKMRERICKCRYEIGRWPNFIAVDFVSTGGQETKIVSDINSHKIDCSKFIPNNKHLLDEL